MTLQIYEVIYVIDGLHGPIHIMLCMSAYRVSIILPFLS
jgi:hypothetical protein